MDAVNAWFDSSNFGVVVLLISVGAAACLFAYGLSILVAGATDPVRKRLAAVTAPVRKEEKQQALDLSWFVNPLAKYLVPKKSTERDSAQTQLIQAGYRSQQALRNFYGIKAVLAISLPVLLLIAARWAPQLSTNAIAFFAILLAFIGVRLPDYVLGHLRGAASSGYETVYPMRSICSSFALNPGSVSRRRSNASRASWSSVIPSSRKSWRS